MKIPSVMAVYTALERQIEPRLAELVRTPGFAQVAAALADARSTVGRTVDTWSARLLHTVNLPAGTDVARLHRQVGELDHEIRRLRMELAEYAEDQQEVRRADRD